MYINRIYVKIYYIREIKKQLNLGDYLNKKLNLIYQLYEELVNKTTKIFENNKENWLTEERESEINFDSIKKPKEYLNRIETIKQEMKNAIKKPKNLNTEVIEKYLDIHIKRLNRIKENLSINNLGTNINILSYLFEDMIIIFKRNKWAVVK